MQDLRRLQRAGRENHFLVGPLSNGLDGP
jgi:hypothetical protein